MSSVVATVTISDELTPLLSSLLSRTTELKRSNKIVGSRLADGVREHISRAAKTRHKTADSLGARRTGYLDRRAQGISIDETGESLNVSIDGAAEIFARVGRDVTIVPHGGRKYLTIPVDKEVFGKRAREISDMKIKHDKHPITGRKGLFLCAAYRGDFRPLFMLVKRAFLPRDEKLLPSNDDIVKLLEQGAIDVIEYETELANGGTRDAIAGTVTRPDDSPYRGRRAPL